jgi:hypothetical protein
MNLKIDCYLMIMLCLGTKERTRRHIEEVLEVWRTSKGARVKMEVQTKSTLSPFWSLGAVCIKMVTRSHTNSIFDAPHMDGKIISLGNQ